MTRGSSPVASFVVLALSVTAALATPAAAQVASPSAAARARVEVRAVRVAAGARRPQAPAQRVQTRPPAVAVLPSRARWEFEVHGGAGSGSSPYSGTARLPTAGQGFLLADGFTSSRLVSSWYFGDGASLFNQVMTLRGVPAGTPKCGNAVCAPSIAQLDTALSSETVARSPGGQVGARLGRTLTPRLSAEFVLDVGLNHLAFVRAVLPAVELARGSFVTAITALDNSSPSTLLPNPTISSKATIVDHTGTEMLLLGALTFALKADGPNVPFVTVGEGVAMDRGPNPSVKLVGDYVLTTIAGATIHQTDTVTIRNASSASLVFVAGGGLKHEFSARSGLRLEGRVAVTTNTMNALLDAQPLSVSSTPAGIATLNLSNPGLQFSSGSPRTNLSGAPITGFIAYEGSGPRIEASVSVGYFRRF